MIPFRKYHALGNDYLVLDPADVGERPDAAWVQRLCRRRRGVGADGIVLGPLPATGGVIGVRIYNPDGAEAEMSGNGLRIFARALHDRGLIGDDSVALVVANRRVTVRVASASGEVGLDLGRPTFDSERIPVTGPPREVLGESWSVAGRRLTVSAVNVGNPHCVVLVDEATAALARELGPLLENDPRFPRRANVQLVRVESRERLRLAIWERGAGHTLASGSSAAAATAVAFRLGLCEADVVARMAGGDLRVAVSAAGVTIAGPVVHVCDGRAALEALTAAPKDA